MFTHVRKSYIRAAVLSIGHKIMIKVSVPQPIITNDVIIFFIHSSIIGKDNFIGKIII